MRLTFWAAFWVLLLDQASKYAVVAGLGLRDRGEINVLPPFLNFRMAWNRGMNFGLFANHTEFLRWLLVALAVGTAIWVALWIRKGRQGRLARLTAGMLIGGALGNALDRIFQGAVADFLNMSCCGFKNPYSFNIADVGVFAGAIGLIFFVREKNTP